MGFSPQAEKNNPTAPANTGRPGAPAPAISLKPLHPHGPLCCKWQLDHQLPEPSEEHWQRHDKEQQLAPPRHGHLHLRAQLVDGKPWECRIPFAELAREGGLILGRSPHEADIELPHLSVSRRHALLEIAESGLVITDLCSTNGTSVNQQALSPCERRVPLAHGADITLGETSLRLEYIH